MLQSLGVVLYIQHQFCHTQAPGVFITPHIGGAVKSMRARGYKFVLACATTPRPPMVLDRGLCPVVTTALRNQAKAPEAICTAGRFVTSAAADPCALLASHMCVRDLYA